jgi:hypothetical protein
MTALYYTMNENEAVSELRFAKIGISEQFDPKIEQMLCFGYSIFSDCPASVIFQIKDKENFRNDGANFEFSNDEEVRFLKFVSETISHNAVFKMVELPTSVLHNTFVAATCSALRGQSCHDFEFPKRLMMAMLVSEHYQFNAKLSLSSDSMIVRMLLTVDHANCDEPAVFNLECSYINGHTLDDENVVHAVDAIFGLPPVAA